MVDYSKWNKFAADVSDDEEDFPSYQPHVTSFDKSQSVSIGPQGSTIQPMGPSIKEKQKVESYVSFFDSFPYNGACLEKYSWTQSALNVALRIPIPKHLKSKDVNVDVSQFNAFSVSLKLTTEVILAGQLRYQIVYNDTSYGDSAVDWEIIDYNNEKYIEIIMNKRCPIPGAVLWWSQVFLDEEEIDVSKLQGRKGTTDAINSTWDEAHRMFRENIQSREAIDIDIDVDESA
jgi:hypothetical protein